MQDVRHQRLRMALERLQGPEVGETITGAARESGDAEAGNFSVDFGQQSGCSRSDVLRAVRSGGSAACLDDGVDQVALSSDQCHRQFRQPGDEGH